MTAADADVHAGHRQRLKEQFVRHGLDPINDVNVLELLLYYAIPRKDTNPVAHRLIDTFGSLAGVLDAPLEMLVTRGGVSQNTALLLKLVPEVSRRQQISRMKERRYMDTTQKCAEYMLPFFYGATVELVYLLALDAKCMVLDCVKISTGEVNSASLSPRSVVERALGLKATSVVLAHNHPSGIAVPSEEDINVTQRIQQALNLVGVYLADHVVVAGDDYVSMMDSGMICGQ